MKDTETPLRLQPSLRSEAERLAAADGVSLDQFVNVALAEKLSALETEAYLGARAARGSRCEAVMVRASPCSARCGCGGWFRSPRRRCSWSMRTC
jgi:hypothetical protein